MNRLSKEKRDRLVMVILGAGGLAATIYFFVISAQNQALADCMQKTDVTREKLTKAERWMRMVPTIQTKLDTARNDLELKQEGMAPMDKFKWFYDTLEPFLAQRQVRLTDITREPELGDVGVLPKFPYQAATFGVKVSARYHDFGSFLADFENQFPYMRIKNLDLTAESVAKPDGRDVADVDARQRSPESLNINMRVVTLVKPTTPL
jgi:hypothetical protein